MKILPSFSFLTYPKTVSIYFQYSASRYLTTDNSVVKEHESDECGVKDGEGDQQVVEGVGHLLPRKIIFKDISGKGKLLVSHLSGENGDREKVSNESNKSHTRHQNSLPEPHHNQILIQRKFPLHMYHFFGLHGCC